MIRRFLTIVILLTVSIASAQAVVPKSRPYGGDGLLIIRPFLPQGDTACCTLPIYREPGVQRIAEMESTDLPSLTPVIQGRPGEQAAVVTGKKGNWLNIIYDDAGREGWVEGARAWDYATWSSFLKGRGAKLLGGLKKDLYQLRRDPSPASPQLDTLSRQKNLRIIDVKDDWALVLVDLTAYGWLRWRDNDGRITLSIDERFDPQKH